VGQEDVEIYACFTSDGIPLYMEVKRYRNGSLFREATWEAQSVSRSVSESEFVPPALPS